MSAYSIPAEPEPWMERGNCLDVDPEMFFPTLGSANAGQSARARAVCKSCPVRLKCLAYALEHHEHGIWGGTIENARTRMRRAAS